MFGFSEAEKLSKLKKTLSGRNLDEVIIEFAEEKYTKKPAIKYDSEILRKIVDYLADKEPMSNEEKIVHLKNAQSHLALPAEAFDIYFAWNKYNAVKSAAEVLYNTTIICEFSQGEWLDHFLNLFLREVGLENIFFFVFPQRSNLSYEDHKISTENREALLEVFLDNIASRSNFCKMANHFAAMNPYFRDFPM